VHLSLAWLALHGPDSWTLVLPWPLAATGSIEFTVPWRLALAISIDNFGGGFAGTALIAYMSGLTGAGFAASQYALLSSLYALPGKLAAGSAGFVVAAFGFPAFFTFTAAIGIPVVLLSLALRPKTAPAEPEPGPKEAPAVAPAIEPSPAR
jgi:PAT family beta-lactamase induction signal transducer AmpG